MHFNIQPILESNNIKLLPLEENDFEAMYSVASDPKIWEQHPNKDRWKREVFQNYFNGAIESKGAFKIIDKQTNEIAGCSRYYDFDVEQNGILIGYTFYATKYWGKGFNSEVKKMMLNYAFQYVDYVDFHIGGNNVRSQIAIGRIGAQKVAEMDIAYYGEDSQLNFVYRILKEDWIK